MSKCSECKRPKPKLMSRLAALAERFCAFPYYQDNDYACGQSDAFHQAGKELKETLEKPDDQ